MDTVMMVGLVGLGVAIGWVACYLLQVRDLTDHIVTMRKQGFVPQFEVEQRKDPGPKVREW